MNPTLIEHIEDFLSGQISRQDLQKLAEELEISDLDKEIAWVRNSQIAIEAAGLRAQWKTALTQAKAPKAKVRSLFSSRIILTIAASIALLLVFYVGFWNKQNSLYDQYAYIDPGLPILMSQSEAYELYDALTYFGEGNYQVAAEKLQAIETSYPESDTLAYYLGASYLYLGKTDLARPALQKVLNKEASEFEQKAEWLLVLADLKDQNHLETPGRLSNILNTPDHEFAEPAAKLAQELSE
ncbi:MAG: tetratricopeptide repeat protein [Bacteroidota bacterium]